MTTERMDDSDERGLSGGVTRREFIKRGAVATATTAAAGSLAGMGSAPEVSAKPRIVRPIQFAHIATRGDMKKQVGWYETVLGIETFLDAGFGAWCSYDDEHHRISLFNRGKVPSQPAGVGGFDHMAFTYSTLEDLAQTYRRLLSRGIQPHRCVHYGPTTSIYYLDPSGLPIELLVDGFKSVEDLERYCADGALMASPSGTDFDPAKFVDKRGTAKADPDTLIKPLELMHTVIKTARYEKLIAFYSTLLGCRVQYQNERAAFLSYDDTSHRIVIVNEPGVTEPGARFGYDHFAHEYASMEDLIVHTYKRVKEAGIKPYWVTNHGMTTSLYYTDPDGNRVETQVDNYKTKQEGMDYIRGEAFRKNPIGVDFDPDEMADKVRGGATYEEMHRRIERPPTGPPPNPVKGEHY